MIDFTRAGSTVRVEIKVASTGWTHYFNFDGGSEWAATLLRNALSESVWNAVKDARADAYAAGWQDAKSKQAKTTWFSGTL